MSDNPFHQPSSGGDTFDPKNHPEWLGKLMLVYPKEYIQGIPTKIGTNADAVSADVIFLDHYVDGVQLKLNNTMIFPKVMVGQTKNAIGGMVLGRLGQGANTKGNAPWLLLDHSETDAQLAMAYIAANPQVTQPSGPPTSTASPAPATAGAASNPWDKVDAAAPTVPVTAGIDPQLVAFLASKGVDVSKIPDENTAKMLAAAYQ